MCVSCVFIGCVIQLKYLMMYVSFIVAIGNVNDMSLFRINVSFIYCGVGEMCLIGVSCMFMGTGGK